MESKRDLVKIGQESFSLLDEYYSSRKGKHSTTPNIFHYQYQPQKPSVYQVMNPVSKTGKMVVKNHGEPKCDLVKVGMEGFAMVDEYYYGKKPSSGPPVGFMQGPSKQQTTRYYKSQAEKPNVYQVKPVYASEEKVMNAYEASKLYGGVLIIDYSTRK